MAKKRVGSDKELEEQMSPGSQAASDESLLLPVAKWGEKEPHKMGEVQFELTPAAFKRRSELGFFPNGELAFTLGHMVQEGLIPTQTVKDGIQVTVTPEIVGEAWRRYSAFQSSLPVSRRAIMGPHKFHGLHGLFGRVTNFTLSVEENTAEDLSSARDLLDQAHQYIQANALRSEDLDYRVVRDLLLEAEGLAREASERNFLSRIAVAGTTAGYTEAMVQTAISDALAEARTGQERFYALRGLLSRLHAAGRDVNSFRESRSHRAQERKTTNGRSDHRPQRFERFKRY